MSFPIVTWTTPFIAAEIALRNAGEDLEFHRRASAMGNLREHLAHIRVLIQWLGENPE